MNFSFNLVHFIILLGAIHGLLLSGLLLGVKRFRKVPNIFLAMFLIGFSLENLSSVFYDSQYAQLHPEWLFLPLSWSLIIAPSFYFYAKTLLDNAFELKKSHLFSFVPFVLQQCLYFYAFVLDKDTKMELFHQNALQGWYDVENLMLLVVGVLFCFWTLRFLYQYKSLQDSGITKIKWQWLVGGAMSLSIVFFIWILDSSIMYTFGKSFNIAYTLWLIMAFIIYWIGYNGYLYPEIFRNESTISILPVAIEDTIKEETAEKYQYSNITEEQAFHILEKVQQAMEQEQLYKNGELTLQVLAHHIDTSPNALSQVINDKLNKNFSDFINAYRIEEVKAKLLDEAYDHYTILAVALECGFNSKSSFNTIFKKHTDLTPSEFRKKYKKTHQNLKK